MPPTTEEKKIPTSAGLETATETVNRINQARNVSANSIPASVVSTETPSLTMPPAPVVPTDTGAVAEGQTLLDQETARAELEAATVGQTISQGEQALREQFGVLQGESDTRTQLEEKANIGQTSETLRRYQETLRRQMAQLDQFDVDNINTIEQMRVDASKRDLTKRTFGAMSAEANIQNAVKRANMVAQTRATIAAIDVTQGNLTAATEQVDKALNAIYEPVRQQMQMEMFFLERNDKRFDAAQKDLANARMMEIQREQAQIDRAIQYVDDAVMSGAATPEEIAQLVNAESTPEEKANLAQSIIGRRAQQEYNLERAIKGRQYDILGLEIDSENAKLLAAQKAQESGTLTPEQFSIANDLRKEVNSLQEVKDAKSLEGDTAALIAALSQENGVGDIAAINSFQRLVVDPGVAVREGDVALLQSAQSFTDLATLRAQGLVKGDKLTPEARAKMLELVRGVYNFRIGLVDESTQQIRNMAQEQGIDYGKYVGKNFKSFEEIQAGITPQAKFELSTGDADTYITNVVNSLSTTPQANPFGISLE